MQQSSKNPRHKKHRDKYRSQRKSHRYNREADFLRAIEGSLHWSLTHLHVAHDVFEHHDGIIDNESHGQRQCQ
jgi:hypothetical protein